MTRSIFEDVGDAPKGRPTETGESDAARRLRGRRRVRLWLILLAAMVAAQIVIGGLTRLTDSGLAITEWRPVTGVVPPMSEADWTAELEKYRATTEYQEQNKGMSMAEFQTLYWWEWGHRAWARLIGLVFVAGFVGFWFAKAIPTGRAGAILAIGGLGALQGVIGWWMVASGLVGRLDVSQHRLAVHLGLAFVILGLLFRLAAQLKLEDHALLQARRRREAAPLLWVRGFLALLFAQIVMGAYVAGLDGGMVYTQWPAMGDGFYPSGEPFAPFTEAPAAQFTHRLLGYAVLVAAVALLWRLRGSTHAATRRWGAILLGVVSAQVTIGVLTLVNAAPLGWALAHQIGAIALFVAAIHALAQVEHPKAEAIARG